MGFYEIHLANKEVLKTADFKLPGTDVLDQRRWIEVECTDGTVVYINIAQIAYIVV